MADPTAAWIDAQGRSPCRGVSITFEAWSIASQAGRGDEDTPAGRYREVQVELDQGDAYIIAHELNLLWGCDESLLRSLASRTGYARPPGKVGLWWPEEVQKVLAKAVAELDLLRGQVAAQQEAASLR